jgi:lipopolysaccharide transport system permease protein
LLPWNLFSSAMARAGSSVVGSSNLISKIYFPRLVVPLSSVISGVLDFMIGLLILLAMMAAYGRWPGVEVLAAPAFVLLALVVALGAGLWLAALNVRYRDVGYVIPFAIQTLMFASPVFYSAQVLIHGHWAALYDLNPLATCINGFRWALLGAAWHPGVASGISVAASVALLASGAYFFRHLERTFADVI